MHRTPLTNLNEIPLEPPTGPCLPSEIQTLAMVLRHLAGAVRDEDVVHVWTGALILARLMHGDDF
jgi:hypothetical protein